jgi:hypothetical protein
MSAAINQSNLYFKEQPNFQTRSIEETNAELTGMAKIFDLNTRMINGLLKQDTPFRDIVRITGLHETTVKNRIKYIKNKDLSDPKFVNLASTALKYHLKEKSLEAVKMVYNHVNKNDESQSKQNSKNVINISFDGLSNSESGEVINGKTVKYIEGEQ